MLLDNYGGNGIFAHKSANSFSGILRGRIGTFADQFYPIYAFSKFYEATENTKARQIVLDAAKKICGQQGEMGQWWWRYDSITGDVFGKYPVYSVHQDGMAPMTLLAASKATGYNFDKYIYKGLNWIFGNNELMTNMIDSAHSLILRSIYRNKYRIHPDEILLLFKIRQKERKNYKLNLMSEFRPYHLRWILCIRG